MSRAPDHVTLCRAFKYLIKPSLVNSMLDQQVQWAEQRKLLGGKIKPAALDSSMFESRYVSRHFEKRRGKASVTHSRNSGKHAENRWPTAAAPRWCAGCPSSRWPWTAHVT